MTQLIGGVPATLQAAADALHMVKWFFLGFASGREPGRDETAGQHLLVERATGDVAEFLARLLDGKRRTLIPGQVSTVDGRGTKINEQRHDGGLVIITYAELERLVDGLPRYGSRSRHVDRDDQRIAADTAKRIVDEFNAEGHEFLVDDDVPF